MRISLPIAVFCLATASLSAQSAPPLLQIVRETIAPGGDAKYDEIERALSKLCAEKNCPNRYLGLSSVTSPVEVWWFNMYASQEAVERVTKAYASRPDLLAEMTRLSDGKQRIVSASTNVFYVPIRERTRAARWALGDSPYAVVAETLDRAFVSFAFTAPGGKVLRIEARATREDAEAMAARWGKGARVFQIRPEWSRPDDAWVARNPALWGGQ